MLKLIKLLVVMAAAGMLALAASGGAYADQLNRSVTKSGMTVHYGIVPAEQARSVDRGASEPVELASVPGLSSYHLVVALFDKATGERISNAAVSATVTGPGPKSRSRTQVKPLQEVIVNDMVTYGNYFDMSWRGRYRIDLSITRKDSAKPTNVRLTYDHHP
ncbi:DUF4426 domain-containing protein [Paraburkholderia sacchari]|uniref:hypothetical protein n=1 Tax=Paraburkholderia sacchari TaxID=159450 RepID=UPI0039A689DD